MERNTSEIKENVSNCKVHITDYLLGFKTETGGDIVDQMLFMCSRQLQEYLKKNEIIDITCWTIFLSCLHNMVDFSDIFHNEGS